MQTLCSVSRNSQDINLDTSLDLTIDQIKIFGIVDCLHTKTGVIWNPDIKTINQYVNSLDQDSLRHLPMVIEGNFLLIVRRANATYIFCDRFCKHRIFYKITNDQISFYDRLLTEGSSFTLDINAVKTFLVYRYVPTGQTLFQGIQQIMPGEIIKINHTTCVVEHLLENTFPSSTSDSFELLEAENKYHFLLQQALEKRISQVSATEKILLPLSGGFDSRVILATVLEIIPADRLVTFTYGQPDTYDYEIGNKVAKDIGVRHVSFPLGYQDFSLENLLESCSDTGGQISFALEAPLRVYNEMRNQGQTILSGNVGGGVMGYLYMPKFDHPKPKEEIFLLDAFCRNPLLLDMIHDQKMIEESFYFAEDPLSLLNMYERWMFINHITKYTHYCNYKLRTQFNYISPYLDFQVCNYALSLPANQRKLCHFYFQYIKDRYPMLANEPFTIFRGATLSSSKLTKYMTYQYDHARQILTGRYRRANKLDFAKYRKELLDYPSLRSFLSKILEPSQVNIYFSTHPHDQMMHTVKSLQLLCENFDVSIP
jgi:asparagine synthetase B (glutamine-hydrolysing)